MIGIILFISWISYFPPHLPGIVAWSFPPNQVQRLPTRNVKRWQNLNHVGTLQSPSSSISSSPSALKVKVGRVEAGPISISAMGCGTWSWGNRFLWNYDTSQDEDLYEAYQTLRNAGVTLFDTADSYGTLDLNGRSEILLGQFERRFLAAKNGEGIRNINNNKKNENVSSSWTFLLPKSILPTRNSISKIDPQQVATKFAPYPWRIFPSSMVHAAKSSLQRLQQDKLSIAQLHWSTANYQPFQEQALWEGIAQVYEQGLCDAIGVSNYGPVQLNKIHQFFQTRIMGDTIRPLSTAQIQYSLMTFTNGSDSRNMLDLCNQLNVRLISYSPLCLGLLTCKYTEENLPPVGNPRRQLFRELLPGAKPLLSTLQAIANEIDKTPSQVAINWTLCKGTVPIPGARTVRHAKENLGAIGWKLRSDMVEALDREASLLRRPMIQNIFQTQ